MAIIAFNLWQVRYILMEGHGRRKMLNLWLLGDKGVCLEGGIQEERQR